MCVAMTTNDLSWKKYSELLQFDFYVSFSIGKVVIVYVCIVGGVHLVIKSCVYAMGFPLVKLRQVELYLH